MLRMDQESGVLNSVNERSPKKPNKEAPLCLDVGDSCIMSAFFVCFSQTKDSFEIILISTASLTVQVGLTPGKHQ